MYLISYERVDPVSGILHRYFTASIETFKEAKEQMVNLAYQSDVITIGLEDY